MTENRTDGAFIDADLADLYERQKKALSPIGQYLISKGLEVCWSGSKYPLGHIDNTPSLIVDGKLWLEYSPYSNSLSAFFSFEEDRVLREKLASAIGGDMKGTIEFADTCRMWAPVQGDSLVQVSSDMPQL